jgi:hypothetical protein
MFLMFFLFFNRGCLVTLHVADVGERATYGGEANSRLLVETLGRKVKLGGKIITSFESLGTKG